MKTVYFVQHGNAHTKDEDEKRPLSDSGIKDVQKAADYLKKQNIHIDKIYHSGKLRALQTASIFGETLGIVSSAQLYGMNPNDAPDDLIKSITEDNVMYVGHLPNLENVASKLLGNESNTRVIKFKNGAVLCLEVYNKIGSVKWYITPDMC